MPEIDPLDLRYVPPDGDRKSRLVILFDHPNKSDSQRKKVMSEDYGNAKMIWSLLAGVGVKREEALVMPVCPIYPPSGNMGLITTLGVNMKNLYQDVWNVIDEYPRDIILAIGQYALECATFEKGITKWRGSLIKARDNKTWVLPTINPTMIDKAGKKVGDTTSWLFLLRHDIQQKFGVYYNAPEFDTPARSIYTANHRIDISLKSRYEYSEPHNADFFIREMVRMKEEAKILSFDIETFQETITVFGISDDPYRALSIPFTGIYSAYDEARLIEMIRELMSTDIPKVAQNGSYDCTYLADKWGVEVRGYLYDTMLMHHCLYSEMRHSLAMICSLYTHEPYYKEMAKEANDPNYHNKHWEYNGKDVAVTLECYFALKEDLEKSKLLDFYYKYYILLDHHLMRIQSRGFKIDQAEKKRIKDALESEVKSNRQKFREIVGNAEFNDQASKQIQDYLYNVLHLPIQRHRKTKAITADEGAIQKLKRDHPEHGEVLGLILDIRGSQKLLSTYLGDLEDPDGRIRCNYNVAGNSRKPDGKGGTKTGRLSSTENVYGRGTNLQNQPPSTKTMFVADEGYELGQYDLSAAESYIVAFCSGEERMLDVLTKHRVYNSNYGDKVYYHETIGSIIMGISPKDVVGDLRQLAKKVGHGWNYNMGIGTLLATVHNEMPNFPFTVQMAKECYDNLNKSLTGVVRWRDEIRSLIRRTRCLYNCFGRRRVFLGPTMGTKAEDTFRDGFSTLPQSEISDHLNQGMIDINRFFENDLGDHRAMVLGQVHDSIIFQFRPNDRDIVREYIEHRLTRPLPRYHNGIQCIIPGEFKTGKNWKAVS